jgi:hypothetical protein
MSEITEQEKQEPERKPEQPEFDHQPEIQLKIIKEIERINKLIIAGFDHGNPEDIKKKLRDFTSELGRVDNLYALAEQMLNIAKGYYSENLDINMQATRFREILLSKTSREQRVFRQVERTNVTLKELINALRTQLSFLKQEMYHADQQPF